MNRVIVQPVGNRVEVKSVHNRVELQIFDVTSEYFMLTQFQTFRHDKEVVA